MKRLEGTDESSLSDGTAKLFISAAIEQHHLHESIFRLLRKRSEGDFVTVYDAAVRGLVRVGSVVTRTAAAVGTAALGVTRTAVVGVTSVAARVTVTVGAATAA